MLTKNKKKAKKIETFAFVCKFCLYLQKIFGNYGNK